MNEPNELHGALDTLAYLDETKTYILDELSQYMSTSDYVMLESIFKRMTNKIKRQIVESLTEKE